MLDVFALFATLLTAAPQSQERPSPRTAAAAAAPEGDIPGYVGAVVPSTPWLALGVDARVRYEDRVGGLRGRPAPSRASYGVSRARVFLAVEPESAPVRFALEAQDAPQFASELPETALTVNELDVLQLRVNVSRRRWFALHWTWRSAAAPSTPSIEDSSRETGSATP